jgi:two-component system OmpR family sensor kinase
VLEVADDGPGMSDRDAARAFDRFHRGARSGGGSGGGGAGGARGGGGDGAGGDGGGGGAAAGSGLGLSIVAAIAAAHGGYARLRSAPGAGTTVHLWIPISFPERQGVTATGPLVP